MNYGSVCSGIEAATAAWHPLGWKPAFFSEIDKFPRAVLKHHYPTVPLHGDFITIKAGDYEPIDILVGGTPCQSFSIAGLRKGLADERGNLTLEFIRLAQKLRPRWIVWENVPGVLSQDGGRAFGAFLGGLAECGYGFAYRILDAQYFGVPQRRRRVFVVGHFGDWRPAAEVLFEPESLRGDITPRRETGKEVAGTFTARARSGGFSQDVDLAASGYMRTVEIAKSLNAHGLRLDFETENFVIPIHDKATRHNGGGVTRNNDGSANGLGIGKDGGPFPTLGAHDIHAVAYQINTQIAMRHNALGESTGFGVGDAGDVGFTLQAAHCHAVAHGNAALAVRRITPRECERLQGFPDDYTKIDNKTADSPRYKAIGNSMAVPVMRWSGERINAHD